MDRPPLPWRYAIAIGSNRRGRHGGPRDEVIAAISTLRGIVAVSRIIETPPLGPSIRRFANTAVLIETDEMPDTLLDRLKTIEHAFGRRRGQRWGARVIDLDIILWSGGSWASPTLTIPHRLFRTRDFVLRPLTTIAPEWRDPVTGLSVRHLAHAVDPRRR
ncbi:MAG: 2-amino-4-hydroxy-6-hydroxymethyldihydropteridine diphosphokinase [Sphingomonas sp.]